MASNDPHKTKPHSLYPKIDQSNPNSNPPFTSPPNHHHQPSSPSTSTSLYPSLDMTDLTENLVDPYHPHPHPHPHHPNQNPNYPYPYSPPSAPPEPISYEETLIAVPGAIVHLIDKHYSVELACGDFSIVRLWQGETVVAVFARVAGEVQWPLMKDEAAVRLDGSHYFFSFRTPKQCGSDSSSSSSGEERDRKKSKEKKKKKKKKESKAKEAEEVDDGLLNYGLSFASKGQERLLGELDRVLEAYSAFSVQRVSDKSGKGGGGVLDESVAMEMSPEDMKKSVKKRELMEERCGAYWTTLAPNVEEYSGTAAKLIAAGSGQLIKGILWCGDVTMDRLKWGNEVLMKRMDPSDKKAEISPQTLRRIKRAKRMTKMTEKVATGVLSGVLKVSGVFTSSVANSKLGKKFFNMIPGEILLASLDGFSKICDALEVAGKNVMSTSSTVTTGLVTHKYGDEAGHATEEGLGAAGHAFGTVWAAFKIRKALNPKSALKPTTMAKTAAKAAAQEYKSKKSSK